MKKNNLFNIFYLSTFVLISLINLPVFGEDTQICTQQMSEQVSNLHWLTSIDEGIIQAKKENKFLLIDFCANWCGACHEMDKYTYSNKDVISDLNKDFVTIRVDISKISNSSEITGKYNIAELPSVLFFDHDAKIIPDQRITGFTKPADFLKVLQEVKKIKS